MKTPVQKRLQINKQLIDFRNNLSPEFGSIGTTPDVDSYIKEDFDNNIIEILNLLKRHIIFDYGICCKEDAKLNEYNRKAKDGNRIHSSYKLKNNKVIWIITSGYYQHELNKQYKTSNYCYTTVLFPNEY
tara:strand:- start:290 stop:679 length:390 start_codon:yes stop_codon:yes gene_type:complete